MRQRAPPRSERVRKDRLISRETLSEDLFAGVVVFLAALPLYLGRRNTTYMLLVGTYRAMKLRMANRRRLRMKTLGM